MPFMKAYRNAKYEDFEEQGAYLNYKELKTILHDMKENSSATTPEELYVALIDQIRNVYAWSVKKIDELTTVAEREAFHFLPQELQKKLLQGMTSEEQAQAEKKGMKKSMEEVKKAADAIVYEVLRFQECRNLNEDIIDKILQRNARYTILPPTTKWLKIKSVYNFQALRVDEIFYLASLMYAAVRDDETKKKEYERRHQGAKGESQDFERRSVKYWVHHQDLPFITARVIQHLPHSAMKDAYTPYKLEKLEATMSEGISQQRGGPMVTPPAQQQQHKQETSNLNPTLLHANSNHPFFQHGRSSATSSPIAQLSDLDHGTEGPAPFCLGSLINSVYFDNAQFLFYHRRLERLEGSSLFRIRWYDDSLQKVPDEYNPFRMESLREGWNQLQQVQGTTSPKKLPSSATGSPLQARKTPENAAFIDEIRQDAKVYLELKVHHEAWSGESSVKRRFPLMNKDVDGFLSGTKKLSSEVKSMKHRGTNAKDIHRFKQLAREIFTKISAFDLHPVLRTQYSRAAFQCGNDATVRVSIDTNLKMSSEDFGSSKHWRYIGLDDVHVSEFPYSVVEVKLQCAENERIPAWVEELVQCRFMEAVPKFSKYSHGMATLFGHTHRVKMVPYWLHQVNYEIRAATKQENDDLDHTQGLVIGCFQQASDWLVFGNNPPQDPSIGAKEVQFLTDPNIPEHYFELVGKRPTTDFPPVPQKYPPSAAATASPPPPLPKKEGKEDKKKKLGARLCHPLDLRRRQLSYTHFMAMRDFVSQDADRDLGIQAYDNESDPVPWQTAKRIRVPQRFDPKTFLTSERYFLNWVHHAVVFAIIGLLLVQYGGSNAVFTGHIEPPHDYHLRPISLASTSQKQMEKKIKQESHHDEKVSKEYFVSQKEGEGGQQLIAQSLFSFIVTHYPICLGLIMVISAILAMLYALVVLNTRSRRVYARKKIRFDDVTGPTFLAIIASLFFLLIVVYRLYLRFDFAVLKFW